MRESSYVGRDALALVERFTGIFPDATHYYFKTYTPSPGVDERLGMEAGAELTIQELIAHNLSVDEVVNRMLKGIEVDESRSGIKVAAGDLRDWLAHMKKRCGEHGEALALYSLCENSGGREMHIPMMDFRIKSEGGNPRHRSLLLAALKRLGQDKGALLDSGNSYHYYGFEQLTPARWSRFMIECLLLDPLVDVRYIAHRMLGGKASLRLNEVSHKKNPVVVAGLD